MRTGLVVVHGRGAGRGAGAARERSLSLRGSSVSFVVAGSDSVVDFSAAVNPGFCHRVEEK